MRRALVVFSILAPLAGCGASVEGDVDGEKVPALLSAFFVQRKLKDTVDFDGQPATLFTVAGTAASVFDGCNQAAKRQVNFNDAFDQHTSDVKRAAGDIDAVKKAGEDFADAIVDYDKANVPSDFWSVSLNLSGFDDGKLDGGGADINFKDPDPKPDFQGSVTICRTNDFPEKKKDNDGFFSVKTHQTCFAGVKGTVDVNQYTEDKTLEIVADVDLSRIDDASGVDPDDDSGAATASITAGWCEPLENALDDFDKLVEDAQQP